MKLCLGQRMKQKQASRLEADGSTGRQAETDRHREREREKFEI